MKSGIVSAVVFALAVLAANPASAAGIMVTKDGLSEKAVIVPVGEVISWIDVTGKAIRIVFADVHGAPVLKEFVGREVHVFFDRPGEYRYTLTLGSKQGTREVTGEITVR